LETLGVGHSGGVPRCPGGTLAQSCSRAVRIPVFQVPDKRQPMLLRIRSGKQKGDLQKKKAGGSSTRLPLILQLVTN
jgi:hypothetical protein